jgi:phosphomannomutase / phosphoglucomutase
VVYFAAYHLRTGSCVAVTGSHNPPDYNGFKIVVGGETLSGDAITDLYERIARPPAHAPPSRALLHERDIARTTSSASPATSRSSGRIKVVVDCGNGVAGAIAPQVLEAIGARSSPLFCEVDGTFPNHHPDPSDPANLTDLINMVQRMDADLGLAFDGDGDRLGVVTRQGEMIYPDRLLMLFAQDVLERNPGACVIYDVKCTGHLAGHILRHGGSPVMWKTGHSLIKAKMRETEAELAGEMSGHFFFRERWYGFDDGIYAAARLLEILASRRSPAEEIFASCPRASARRSSRSRCARGRPLRLHRALPRAGEVRGRALSPRSTACAWTGRTAGAWCAPPTPRRWWCCASMPTRRGAGAHPGGVPRAAAGDRAGAAAAVLTCAG